MSKLMQTLFLCLSLIAVQVVAVHHEAVHHAVEEEAHAHAIHHGNEHDESEHTAELCNLCQMAKQAMDATISTPVINTESVSIACGDISLTIPISSYQVAWHSRAPPLI